MSLTGKPSLTTLADIANDEFWPDLAIGDLISKYRIPAEYDDFLIKTGLVNAMVTVNAKLAAVKNAALDLGYTEFTDYAEDRHPGAIDGVNILILHYQQAVFTHAKADLLKQFYSLSRVKKNADATAKEDDAWEIWLNVSQSSIKALFNKVLPDDETTLATANAHVALL